MLILKQHRVDNAVEIFLSAGRWQLRLVHIFRICNILFRMNFAHIVTHKSLFRFCISKNNLCTYFAEFAVSLSKELVGGIPLFLYNFLNKNALQI